MYPMRRKDRAISDTEARALLEKAEYGFLATTGNDGLPYGVPLSYVLLPDYLDRAEADIHASLSRTAVLCLPIEEMTGKAKRPRSD